MAAELYTISASCLPDTVHVVSLIGREAISEIYRFDVGMRINDESFDPKSVLRKAVKISVERGEDAEPFFFQGIIISMELVHQQGTYALYRARIVPKLWCLTQSVHSRIYTDNTILEIIEAVLQANGLAGEDYSFQIMGDYPTIEHVCQYKESDFAFISRWMEREGLYYFFEHLDSGEKIVITDNIMMHNGLSSGSVRYIPLSGSDFMALEAFDSFSAKHSALPAMMKLKDYDYLHPTLELQGSHDVSSNGVGEISMFGENLPDMANSSRYAEVRAQELLTAQNVFHGRGRVWGLRSNYRFTLEDHPNNLYNQQTYLATEIEHTGNQSASDPRIKKLLGIEHINEDEYIAHVTAIPADTQFRARRRQSWPRIDGYELAIVCGADSSEYAQLDDHGRYKCRVMFDESDLVDGSATTYVRMMQPHGGGLEGFHFPLRKATEVLLFFLGGDPDRPVIAGTVPNPLTPSPVTSANHTKNVIQTGGRNRLEMEDMAGAQRVTLSTPYSNSYLRMGSPNDGHEIILRTDDNTLFDFGKTLTILSGEQRFDHVKSQKFDTTVDGTMTNIINGTKTTTVKEKVTETYNNGQETTVNAALTKETYNAAHETTVDGTQTITVNTGLAKQLYNAGHHVEVTSGQYMKVDGDQTLEINTDKTETISGNYNLTVNGSTLVELKGPKQENIDGWWGSLYKSDNVSVTYGLTSSTHLGLKNINLVGGSVTVTVAAKLDLALAATFTFAAGVKATFDGTLDLRAKPMEVATSAAGWCWNSGGCFMVNTPTLVFTGAAFMSRAAIQMIN